MQRNRVAAKHELSSGGFGQGSWSSLITGADIVAACFPWGLATSVTPTLGVKWKQVGFSKRDSMALGRF